MPPVQSQSLVQSPPVASDLATLVEGLGAWVSRPGPIYRRLADAIEDVVAEGLLRPPARLPAERLLARQLDLSRGTVVSAYELLAERRLVERRRGSGTHLVGTARTPAAPRLRFPQLSRFLTGPEVPYELAYGAPQVDDIIDRLDVSARAALAAGAAAHGYEILGLPALRAALAELLTAKGAPTGPEQILITGGAQRALQLLTDALLRRGDRIAAEAPTYPGAMEIFSRASVTVSPLPRDHAGPRVGDLARAMAGELPALLYLVPDCHNPTGGVMPEVRRRELLAVCAEHGVLVVEDHTTADLQFDGAAEPMLARLAPESVVTVGSFSKVGWAGLRVGWIRASEAMITRLGRLKAAQDLGSGLLDQVAALRLLEEWDELLVRRREQARSGHAHLTALLAARLPSWSFTPARGGFSLWVRLPRGNADDFARLALTHGVSVSSGTASAPGDLFTDHLRLCFSLPLDELSGAVDRLATAWRSYELSRA